MSNLYYTAGNLTCFHAGPCLLFTFRRVSRTLYSFITGNNALIRDAYAFHWGHSTHFMCVYSSHWNDCRYNEYHRSTEQDWTLMTFKRVKHHLMQMQPAVPTLATSFDIMVAAANRDAASRALLAAKLMTAHDLLYWRSRLSALFHDWFELVILNNLCLSVVLHLGFNQQKQNHKYIVGIKKCSFR